MLMSMGFGKTHSEQALRATDGDLERAAVWVMSHPGTSAAMFIRWQHAHLRAAHSFSCAC